MKKRTTKNQKLTSERERRRQYIIRGVVKRDTSPGWEAFKTWSRRAIKIMLLAALLAGGYVGAVRGYQRLFWENPDYALKEVRVQTDGTSITREQVIQTAGLQVGRNIFSYPLDAAHDTLKKKLPQIAKLEIRRYLPNRIEVTITERKPIAWLAAKVTDEQRPYMLDAGGVIFRPRSLETEYDKLPVIGGVELQDVEEGKALRKYEMAAALQLLRLVQEQDTFKVLSIDASKGYCLVVTDQKRSQITFGLDDIASQLQRLDMVHREAGLVGQELKTVNLMVARNIPVTFVEPEGVVDETTPPPSEEPAKDAPKPRENTTRTGSGNKASSTKSSTSSKAEKSDREKTTTPRRTEPKTESKPAPKETPKETPKRDTGGGLLRAFRRA